MWEQCPLLENEKCVGHQRQSVLEMANNAKQLEEIDLSNCRKVSDNLLARIVGWVVTEPNPPQASSGRFKHANSNSHNK